MFSNLLLRYIGQFGIILSVNATDKDYEETKAESPPNKSRQLFCCQHVLVTENSVISLC